MYVVLPHSRPQVLTAAAYRTGIDNALTSSAAIITATTLQLLPPLHRLTKLLSLWAVRTAVLKIVPTFVRWLQSAQEALESGEMAINLPSIKSGESKLDEDTFSLMSDMIQQKVATAGRLMDTMLDALEGREDVMPEEWIGTLENIEEGFSNWQMEAERVVLEGRLSEESARERALREKELTRLVMEAERAAQEARDDEENVEGVMERAGEVDRELREAMETHEELQDGIELGEEPEPKGLGIRDSRGPSSPLMGRLDELKVEEIEQERGRRWVRSGSIGSVGSFGGIVQTMNRKQTPPQSPKQVQRGFISPLTSPNKEQREWKMAEEEAAEAEARRLAVEAIAESRRGQIGRTVPGLSTALEEAHRREVAEAVGLGMMLELDRRKSEHDPFRWMPRSEHGAPDLFAGLNRETTPEPPSQSPAPAVPQPTTNTLPQLAASSPRADTAEPPAQTTTAEKSLPVSRAVSPTNIVDDAESPLSPSQAPDEKAAAPSSPQQLPDVSYVPVSIESTVPTTVEESDSKPVPDAEAATVEREGDIETATVPLVAPSSPMHRPLSVVEEEIKESSVAKAIEDVDEHAATTPPPERSSTPQLLSIEATEDVDNAALVVPRSPSPPETVVEASFDPALISMPEEAAEKDGDPSAENTAVTVEQKHSIDDAAQQRPTALPTPETTPQLDRDAVSDAGVEEQEEPEQRTVEPSADLSAKVEPESAIVPEADHEPVLPSEEAKDQSEAKAELRTSDDILSELSTPTDVEAEVDEPSLSTAQVVPDEDAQQSPIADIEYPDEKPVLSEAEVDVEKPAHTTLEEFEEPPAESTPADEPVTSLREESSPTHVLKDSAVPIGDDIVPIGEDAVIGEDAAAQSPEVDTVEVATEIEDVPTVEEASVPETVSEPVIKEETLVATVEESASSLQPDASLPAATDAPSEEHDLFEPEIAPVATNALKAEKPDLRGSLDTHTPERELFTAVPESFSMPVGDNSAVNESSLANVLERHQTPADEVEQSESDAESEASVVRHPEAVESVPSTPAIARPSVPSTPAITLQSDDATITQLIEEGAPISIQTPIEAAEPGADLSSPAELPESEVVVASPSRTPPAKSEDDLLEVDSDKASPVSATSESLSEAGRRASIALHGEVTPKAIMSDSPPPSVAPSKALNHPFVHARAASMELARRLSTSPPARVTSSPIMPLLEVVDEPIDSDDISEAEVRDVGKMQQDMKDMMTPRSIDETIIGGVLTYGDIPAEMEPSLDSAEMDDLVFDAGSDLNLMPAISTPRSASRRVSQTTELPSISEDASVSFAEEAVDDTEAIAETSTEAEKSVPNPAEKHPVSRPAKELAGRFQTPKDESPKEPQRSRKPVKRSPPRDEVGTLPRGEGRMLILQGREPSYTLSPVKEHPEWGPSLLPPFTTAEEHNQLLREDYGFEQAPRPIEQATPSPGTMPQRPSPSADEEERNRFLREDTPENVVPSRAILPLRVSKVRGISATRGTSATSSTASSRERSKRDSSPSAGDPSRPTTPSQSGDELDQRVNSILNTLPSKVKLTASNLKKLTESTRKAIPMKPWDVPNSHIPAPRSVASSASTNSQMPGGRAAARRHRSSMQGEIKLYHLHRTNGQQPIKLYIRLVGANGERVMVRVGGGWADLAEYLREYAMHHGTERRSISETRIEVHDLPSDTMSHGRLRPSASNSSLARSPTPYRSPSPAFASRPDSPSVLRESPVALVRHSESPLPSPSQRLGRNSPVFIRGGGSVSGNVGVGPVTPTLPGFPRSQQQATTTPSNNSSGTPPSRPTSSSSSSAVGSTFPALRRPASHLSFTESPPITANDAPLGLAGPRSRKVAISPENQAWVEGMVGQVRRVSGSVPPRRPRARSSVGGGSDWDDDCDDAEAVTTGRRSRRASSARAPSRAGSATPYQVGTARASEAGSVRAPSRSSSVTPQQSSSKTGSEAGARAPSRVGARAPSRTGSVTPQNTSVTTARAPSRASSVTPQQQSVTKSTAEPSARAPSKVSGEPTARAPSRAGSEIGARAPSRAGGEAGSRIPSKAGSESGIRAPSRTGGETSTRVPSRLGREPGVRAPSRAGIEPSIRAPSRAGGERAPSKAGTETSIRAPSRAGGERAPSRAGSEIGARAPSRTGGETGSRIPSKVGGESGIRAPSRTSGETSTRVPSRLSGEPGARAPSRAGGERAPSRAGGDGGSRIPSRASGEVGARAPSRAAGEPAVRAPSRAGAERAPSRAGSETGSRIPSRAGGEVNSRAPSRAGGDAGAGGLKVQEIGKAGSTRRVFVKK